MDFYHVKNWKRFQHYKHRCPPWIKLHFEILTSPDWVMWNDASKLLAVACMLVASRNAGRVPIDPSYIKRVAYLNENINFKPLIECGFLLELQAQDSVSKHKHTNAEPETETETEDDDEPPKSLISSEAILLANEITVLAGHDVNFQPPSWVGGAYRIQTWISNGWPREAILASVQKQMASKKGSPPSTVQYFEKGIADFIAQQSNPLPKGVNGNGTKRTVQDAAADLLARVKGFDQPAPSPIRDGENATTTRLLSKG